MRKFYVGLLLFLPVIVYGQNIQLHYDGTRGMRSNSPPRNYLTATLDFYKTDDHGSFWWFVDFDFDDDNEIGLAYVEIARDQKIGRFPLQAHFEFNGGLVSNETMSNSYHIGVMYPYGFKELYFDVALMYSYTTGSEKHNDMKFALNWSADIFEDKVSIIGFFNLWSQDAAMNSSMKTGKNLCILSEPQFWYNLNRSFSIGSEIEFSYNFLYDVRNIQVYPTLAVRYFF